MKKWLTRFSLLTFIAILAVFANNLEVSGAFVYHSGFELSDLSEWSSSTGSPSVELLVNPDQDQSQDTTTVAVYSSNWEGQTFTTNSAYTIKYVSLYGWKSGSPGTITVSIQAVDGSSHPDGSDLCSGTFDGNSLTGNPAWFPISMGAGYSLSSSTMYAVVVRATGGDGSNYFGWRYQNTDVHSGGADEGSIDSGSSWTTTSGADKTFRVSEDTPNTGSYALRANTSSTTAYVDSGTDGYRGSFYSYVASLGTLTSGDHEIDEQAVQITGDSSAFSVGALKGTVEQALPYFDDDSNYLNCYGDNWFAQTFTTGSGYDITHVALELHYNGSPPNDLTIAIKAVDGSSKPTGSNLASATVTTSDLVSSGTYSTILVEFSSSYTLSSSTEYAIVGYTTAGSVGNTYRYGMDADDSEDVYTGGVFWISSDAGSTWSYYLSQSDLDLKFATLSDTSGISLVGFYGDNKVIGYTTSDDSEVLSYESWDRISFTQNTSTNDIKLFVDGTEVFNHDREVSPASFDMAVGVMTSATADMYFDDIAFDDDDTTSTDLGDVRVAKASPNAAGTYDQYDQTSDYTNVDEIPVSDADKDEDNGSDVARQSYNIPNLDSLDGASSGDTVNAVSIYIRGDRDGGGETDHMAMTRDNGADQNSADLAFNGIAWFNWYHADMPQDSGAWSEARFNALEIGAYHNGAQDQRVHGLQAMVAYTPAVGFNISNTPTTENLGVVADSSTYYAYGSAPSNPVVDGECTFTITNNGDAADIDIKATDFTGGTTWNLVSGAPSTNEVRVTAYCSGDNPASGVVVANTDQELYDGLASSSTIKWDFKFETGTLADEADVHTSTFTVTAVTED
jgi:hypothetical protein